MTENTGNGINCGRVAVVTGAGSGIGAAIARRLASEGAAVICADRSLTTAMAVVEEIESAGGAACAVAADIADEASILALAEAVRTNFGPCDILVNNAGIGDDTPTDAMTMERYRRILAVNLDGTLAVTLALLPALKRSPAGRIVNIASLQGLRGTRDSLAYGISKGGVVNMTRALACDLADDGILVNALAPGFIDTPMAVLADGSKEYDTDWFFDIYVKHGRIPLRRPGLPEEVAEAALFFSSSRCRYITGQILLIDGGLSATF